MGVQARKQPELTKAEFKQLLERRCQQYLKMSLRQFVAARKAGRLKESPAAAYLESLLGAAPR
jgi:hypothetical protein